MMVAALIMARGYKACGFQGQVQIGSRDAGVDRHNAALVTARCRTGDGTARCRTDVIGLQRNFP
ncbi:hypothetical protein ACNJYA_20410 [Bradyrhizobium sp. DASA03068]|uniref:hypothetical protein n=1 Tax=Bradyrhizobium sp. BLXBL-01 TaxID=3395915 RepID=UPI003F6F1BEA